MKEPRIRTRILSILAYTGAALTLVVAICVPFVLMGAFSNAVAHAGLHIAAAYSGGTVARTIDRGRYTIVVYQPVEPRLHVKRFEQQLFLPEIIQQRVANQIRQVLHIFHRQQRLERGGR